MTLIQRISWELKGLLFLASNLWFAFHLRKMQPKVVGGIQYRGCGRRFLKQYAKLHESLRGGRRLNLWRHLLYTLKGESLVAIALTESGQVIGFQMFYFRPGEREQAVVHSAFSGVIACYQGKGIGTELRRFAISHFRQAGLNGASMYIWVDNEPSMKSSERAGYRKTVLIEDGKRYLMAIRFDEK